MKKEQSKYIPCKFARLSLVALAALLGATLLTLSYPRLRADIEYLPVATALRNHWNFQAIRHERFPNLIAQATTSTKWLGAERYWHGLAWLHYLHADSLEFNTELARASLAQSEQAFSSLLKVSPVEPAEWLRLGWVKVLLGRPAQEIISVWEMSVHTGSAEHYLLLDRLQLALPYADLLDEYGLALLRDQILLTWKYRTQDMLQALSVGSIDLPTIKKIIHHQTPEIFSAMEKRHEKHH